MLHHGIAVTVLDRLCDQSALNISPIDIIIFVIPVSACDHRAAQKAVHSQHRALRVDGDQLLCDLSAVNIVHQFPDLMISAGVKLCLIVHYVFKRYIRMRQCKMFYQRAHISAFRGGSLQKLCPGGRIVEDMVHQEGRSVRSPDFLNALLRSAFNHIPRSRQFSGRLGDQLHLGDRRDA